MAKRKHKKVNHKKIIFITVFILVTLFIFKNSLKPIIGTIQSYSSAFFHDYNNNNYTFGIDVSHYQEKINWGNVVVSKHPIQFVFVRATMGSNRTDDTFKYNWKKTKSNGLIRGAYHYYDPNQNSTLQAQNFIQIVKLKTGDLPPVLDIEELSKFGNTNLHKGLQNWLDIVQAHYKAKPIIYTGYKYYQDNLQSEFKNYPLWIASYSRSKNNISDVNWQFHQFTDKVSVYGIESRVDGNDFNGDLDQLKTILMK